MGKRLVMLPEAPPTARLLLRYVFDSAGPCEGPVDLLILRKQRAAFEEIISSFPFREVVELDEEYYGRVTNGTADFIRRSIGERYDVAYFPFNTFKANAFLLGSALAAEVRAVNASLYGKKEVPVVSFRLDEIRSGTPEVPWAGDMEAVKEAKERAGEVLARYADDCPVSGERPSFGIIEGFGHDLELFCNYALGAMDARCKRVLDAGGGLGYGSYLLSRFADEVVYMDRSPETVRAMGALWKAEAGNITPVCADLSDAGMKDGSFDVVFLMEMLEHVRDPLGALASARRLLKEGGRLVVTTPEEDLFPYSVSPVERWDDPPDELLEEAIWPWHIQPLGEAKLLPMLAGAGFEVEKKRYITYIPGAGLVERCREALGAGDAEGVSRVLNSATRWSIEDFGVTRERDPYFSAFFYNVTARKVSQ